MEISLKGEPIPVVLVADHSFTLDEFALRKILLDPRVIDRPVVVVSVAGAFRKGKSFLLDFFLRYLNAPNDPNWLGDVDSPLKGFSWRGGSERDTTGILMWSEPFIIKRGQEEVAVLLMDTQGAFDTDTTVTECATVFALSTMLSSVQVYNLSGNIQEDDLQHLQLFTEYGRLALESNNDQTKPFKTLQFLVRDWSYPYEYAYGARGGKKKLERILKVSVNQQPELKQLREHIRSCFQKIDCFLLPHPGRNVAENPKFDGRLMEMRKDFKEHLKIFIEMLLNPANLVVKEENRSNVNGPELLEYFTAYMKIFQGNTLPKPMSMYQATAEVNNLVAVSKARDVYCREMDLICAPDKPYLKTNHLDREHKRCAEMARAIFTKSPKMGGVEISQPHAKNLEKYLQERYDHYVICNNNKPHYTIWEEVAQYAVPSVAGAVRIAIIASSVAVFTPGAVLSAVGTVLSTTGVSWVVTRTAIWLKHRCWPPLRREIHSRFSEWKERRGKKTKKHI